MVKTMEKGLMVVNKSFKLSDYDGNSSFIDAVHKHANSVCINKDELTHVIKSAYNYVQSNGLTSLQAHKQNIEPARFLVSYLQAECGRFHSLVEAIAKAQQDRGANFKHYVYDAESDKNDGIVAVIDVLHLESLDWISKDYE